MTTRKPIDWSRVPLSHAWHVRHFGERGTRWIERGLNVALVVMLLIYGAQFVAQRVADTCLKDRVTCENLAGVEQ